MHTACVTRELPWAGDFASAVDVVRADACCWWLDSASASPRSGRFSYAGSDPYAVVRARDGRVELEVRRAARPDLPVGWTRPAGEPLAVVRRLLPGGLPRDAVPELPFVGGAVGYLGYELAAGWEGWEPLARRGEDDLGLPDLVLLLVDQLLACDHLEGRLRVVGLGFAADPARARARAAERAEALCERIGAAARPGRWLAAAPPARPVLPRQRPMLAGLDSRFDASSYAGCVREVQERIAAGDVYQVCLTHRIGVPFAGSPGALYDALRLLDPVPFGALLELPELAIASGSPERFLALGRDRWVESRPIKGTRPRGGDPLRDRALQRELASSPKDRAENLMIVDLVRNDLGRVCELGSVHVPELMRIEPYAGVFQMVSTVRGRLRRGQDIFDLLRAAFPPGSMTGAPKLAAMRILAELEPVRRGVYSGALGYLDLRGGAGLSVVIRSALLCHGRAWLHVGGGIVADSDPAAEWQESWDKARALLVALAAARPADAPGDASTCRPEEATRA